MLTITQVNYIRELYHLEGRSYSEICAMTRKNYRTIKKYIQKENFNEEFHQAKRPTKTSELIPIIRGWLAEDQARHRKQRHTAKRIYDRLKTEYPSLLNVSARTVRTLVKQEKENLYGASKAYLLLNHPGGEAQVDFGTLEAFENGSLKKFHELVLSFPKSNAGFTVLTRSETREAVFEGLQTIFQFLKYVPKAIWFDQMSAAVLRSRDDNGTLKVPDAVTRFSMHYGFTIKFCNPQSGHEKGNVENKVGALRRNLFVPEPVIHDLDAFNADLLKRCHARNKELHYRLKQPIESLFHEERSLMIPCNNTPFDVSRYESRKVNKYGLIDFSGCRYSASPKHIGQHVTLKITANELEILSRDLSESISKHPRFFEKGQESIKYIDFIDVVKTRPNAFKYSGIYSLLPSSWQDYLNTLDKEGFRQAFNVLKMILQNEDLDFADRVLQETIKHDSISPEAVAVTYKRLKENRFIYEADMKFPSDLPPYEVDTSQYDKLMLDGCR